MTLGPEKANGKNTNIMLAFLPLFCTMIIHHFVSIANLSYVSFASDRHKTYDAIYRNMVIITLTTGYNSQWTIKIKLNNDAKKKYMGFS